MVSADYRFLAGVTSHQGALEHPRRYAARNGALNKPRQSSVAKATFNSAIRRVAFSFPARRGIDPHALPSVTGYRLNPFDRSLTRSCRGIRSPFFSGEREHSFANIVNSQCSRQDRPRGRSSHRDLRARDLEAFIKESFARSANSRPIASLRHLLSQLQNQFRTRLADDREISRLL